MDGKLYEMMIAQYSGPAFAFDIDALRGRTSSIKSILGRDVMLCYSIKANPFFIPEIIDLVDRIEVCSPGELDICKYYKAPPEKIIYSGVNKQAEDIKEAMDYGCALLTVESLLHAELINKEASARGKNADVLLRLNAGSQFGMSLDDLYSILKNPGKYDRLDIRGLHYFVGTQRKSKHQTTDMSEIEHFLNDCKANTGFDFKHIEYGPGLCVPYFEGDDFSDTLAPVRLLAPQLDILKGKGCSICVEMGRFIAAECGYYFSEIADLKSDGANNYAILDGGINHLNYFGQIMGMKIPAFDRIDRGGNEKYENKSWHLCGSLCSVNDIIAKEVPFEELAVRDILVFKNCGAYSVTEGIYLFLSRRMPEIVFYKGGRLEKVRSAISTDIFNRKE